MHGRFLPGELPVRRERPWEHRRPPLGRPSRSVGCVRESVGRRLGGPPPVHVHGRSRLHGRHPTGSSTTRRLTVRMADGHGSRTP
ncbi:hypothetical protein GZL_06399 [Streptomyces sp. 769]|nr:hypothetical protein GZL_06399 [Streptomyces sp. 769]